MGALSFPPSAASGGTDVAAARLTDPRFYGIERIDLKARYGARCDGTTHPLNGLYASLAAAQAAYPNAGLTSGNWSAMEVDTAAWLQAEADLYTGSGGIIGLQDGSIMMVSSQLWLRDAGRVWFHGGRNTTLMCEGIGAMAAIRVSKASMPDRGTGRAVSLRNLCLLALKQRYYFASDKAGVAATGVASSAAADTAMSGGSTGAYRSGSTGVVIDDGGQAGQSGTSAGWQIDAVRVLNFENGYGLGQNTYTGTFTDCMAENCHKGAAIGGPFSNNGGSLNTGERIVFRGGNWSNNNHGAYLDSTFLGSGNTINEQYSSIFFEHGSMDYNLVSQITYRSLGGGSANGSVCHFEQMHIENNTTCIGNNPWVQVQGRIKIKNSMLFDNGSPNMPAFVQAVSGSSITVKDNTVNGNPIMVRTTGLMQDIETYVEGNTVSYNGGPVIAVQGSNGSILQPPALAVSRSVTSGSGNADFALKATKHDYIQDIFLDDATTLTLPAPGVDTFKNNHTIRVWNTSGTKTVTTQVPVGVYCGGNNGYQDNRSGTSTQPGPTLPPKTMQVLRHSGNNAWGYFGTFTSAYPG